MMPDRLGRRGFLGLGAAALVSACALGRAPLAGTSAPAPSGSAPVGGVGDALAALERRLGGRVGVCAYRVGGGDRLERRADERFAFCSTFKWALAAAVLGRVDRGEMALDELVAFGNEDLQSWAPFTRAHLAEGRLPVEALARAAVTVSDNTATNLLLARLGGPAALTRFFREIGDTVTRLDRDEPSLNTNRAGDARDTTSPRAMAGALERVLTGEVLSLRSRETLTRWLVETETGRARLRAGLPPGWRAGDKTGTGKRGACNDVAILWPPSGAPWVVAAYLSDSRAALGRLEAAHAEIGRQIAASAR